MAGKADFTEEDWRELRQGVTAPVCSSPRPIATSPNAFGEAAPSGESDVPSRAHARWV
jgi:hypothetical protein